MIELWEFAVLGAMMLITVLSGLYLGVRVAKPALLKSLRGEAMSIGNQVSKSLAETIENVDVGEIMSQIGGGGGEEGASGGIGDLAGLASAFGVDLGPLGALMAMGGKKKGSSTENPFLK